MAHTKAEHPLPARIMHGVHLACLLVLVPTGLYIHKPNFSLFGLDMNLAKQLHYSFAFFILLNSVVRVYWAFFGKPRDIR